MSEKSDGQRCHYHLGTRLVRVRGDEPLGYWRTEQGVSRVSRKRQATLRANNVRTILRCPIAGCPCVASLPGEQEEA